MLDQRVRTVRVPLVLADVLHPAGREVAAEHQVRQLQGGVVGMGARYRRQRQAQRGLYRPGPVDQGQRSGVQRRYRRQVHGGPVTVPGGQCAFGRVDRLLRRQVTDDDHDSAGRVQPLPVQRADRGRGDREHLLRRRRLHRVRVAAVHPLEQRHPGQVRRLALGHLDPVDQPGPFGGHLVGRVRGAGQYLGQQVEQPVESGHQGVAGHQQPVGIGAGGQSATDLLQLGGDVHSGHLGGTGEQGLCQHGGAGQVGLRER